MTTIANNLLEFLLSLLRDPEAAAAFRHDPEKALENAGLSDVCTEDVEAVLPVIFDYAPVRVDSSFDRDYNTGRNESDVGGNISQPPPWRPDRPDRDDGDRPRDDDDRPHDDDRPRDDDDDHAHAVQQLSYVVNNYSYTSKIDDRDTITDQSVNQNIWADGDVVQLFDNDAVIASGDHAVAAGDDADVDNSHDESTNTWVDVEDGEATVVVGDDNFSDDIENSGNYADRGGSVEDNDTEIDNDGQYADRGGENHDTDVDVDFDNSGQIAGGDAVHAEDEGQAAGDDLTDNDTDVDVDVDFDNSGQIAGGDATDSHDETAVDVDFDNSGQIAGGDATSTDVDVDFENEGQIAGGDVNQNETDIDAEFTDNSGQVNDSLNGNDIGNTDTDVDIEDSFTVEDSFTQDNDVVDVDDSLNDNETEVEL
ncbi:IniB N-terminal domain-containing protein [Georgenia sp. EYE_87]|uniref:IniB N-terminal domain-containing protein n=1 Tax=Georgenia sp. EYE_87 TaxID=2853448 RepID=UPI002005C41A|nr:IniB N-terminal domain-containing protein [Georgenia sp. EYE_87]MCK6211726.1 IniB N-terminal domain-containing protein [Georgenia sp. EYE_87]